MPVKSTRKEASLGLWAALLSLWAGKKMWKRGVIGWRCWLAIFFLQQKEYKRKKVKVKSFKLRLKRLSCDPETGSPWEVRQQGGREHAEDVQLWPLYQLLSASDKQLLEESFSIHSWFQRDKSLVGQEGRAESSRHDSQLEQEAERSHLEPQAQNRGRMENREGLSAY